MRVVADRFQAMELKGEPVTVDFPATEPELPVMVEHVRFIDPSISDEDLLISGFKNAPALQMFLRSHCHSSHYLFQIKKYMYMYTDPHCYYCPSIPCQWTVCSSVDSPTCRYHFWMRENKTSFTAVLIPVSRPLNGLHRDNFKLSHNQFLEC